MTSISKMRIIQKQRTAATNSDNSDTRELPRINLNKHPAGRQTKKRPKQARPGANTTTVGGREKQTKKAERPGKNYRFRSNNSDRGVSQRMHIYGK